MHSKEVLVAGKILVIGATGTVGRELVTLLAGKGEEVRVASRHRDLQPQIPTGNEAVVFDLENPDSFEPALNEIDRVFLIARPGDERADEVALPLIKKMQHLRIRHVVNLSAFGAETRANFALRKIEISLEDSGMGFTHLRPNWFMQIFSSASLLTDIRSTGAIHIPGGDAKISYIDARDIAAVAAEALTQRGHVGKAYTLTGAESLDFNEVAQSISRASGREVRYAEITEDAARAALEKTGFSAERVERLVGFYRLVRRGFCMPVSQDFSTVLGREPIRFSQFARDNASCWM